MLETRRRKMWSYPTANCRQWWIRINQISRIVVENERSSFMEWYLHWLWGDKSTKGLQDMCSVKSWSTLGKTIILTWMIQNRTKKKMGVHKKFWFVYLVKFLHKLQTICIAGIYKRVLSPTTSLQWLDKADNYLDQTNKLSFLTQANLFLLQIIMNLA